MFRSSISATGGLTITYEGNEIDFSKFERIPMRDAILKYEPGAEIDDRNIIQWFDDHVESSNH